MADEQWNRLRRRNGSRAPQCSHAKQVNIPAIPKTRGTSVLKLLHAYCVPPHEIAMRKDVVLAMNIAPPTQSTRKSFSLKDDSVVFRRTYIATITNPIAQNGKLRKKIQRQVECWTRRPPMVGPRSIPRAAAAWISPTHFGRDRSGTMSVKMTRVIVMIPPPPTPCMHRATRSVVKLWATPATRLPKANSARDGRSNCCRPKTSDTAAIKGWKTALVKR